MLKYLIIITLCYYLVKGLIYLILWQATKKVEEKSRESKQRAKQRKFKRGKDGWYFDDEDEEL
ncbi:MAG: G-protein coupled receptor [Syntrophomonadaceae bacterium]|nr:G-protein coupled receptor [Syntrophomonadaceae bacterium]